MAFSASDEGLAGWYINYHKGVYTTIHVVVNNDKATVDIRGGHVGDGPESMSSGDCNVVAVGTLQGRKLVADFLPTQWDKKKRQVSMTFGNGQLKVHGADLEGRCGWFTCFWGIYNKLSCGDLKELFHKELSHYREHPEDLKGLCQ